MAKTSVKSKFNIQVSAEDLAMLLASKFVFGKNTFYRRITCKLKHCEIREGNILLSTIGMGRSKREALANCLKQIRGKILIVYPSYGPGQIVNIAPSTAKLLRK